MKHWQAVVGGIFAIVFLMALYPQVERVTSTTISINSQGASGAPLSVTNAVATVIPFLGVRHEWAILAETVSIRCIACTTVPCSPVPSATVGFLIPVGTIVLEQVAPSLAVQCFSTGAATNVDTWEDN